MRLRVSGRTGVIVASNFVDAFSKRLPDLASDPDRRRCGAEGSTLFRVFVPLITIGKGFCAKLSFVLFFPRPQRFWL